MSRRCLICANINPCRQHSDADQDAELRRNTREVEGILAERAALASPSPDTPEIGDFRPMEEWDQRDEAVLLMVDYGDEGEHAIDDATVALTIGHNNDHNVGEDEGEGWKFAGWCWSHDHYVEGKGKPIGWMPLPHAVARAIEDKRVALATPNAIPNHVLGDEK